MLGTYLGPYPKKPRSLKEPEYLQQRRIALALDSCYEDQVNWALEMWGVLTYTVDMTLRPDVKALDSIVRFLQRLASVFSQATSKPVGDAALEAARHNDASLGNDTDGVEVAMAEKRASLFFNTLPSESRLSCLRRMCGIIVNLSSVGENKRLMAQHLPLITTLSSIACVQECPHDIFAMILSSVAQLSKYILLSSAEHWSFVALLLKGLWCEDDDDVIDSALDFAGKIAERVCERVRRLVTTVTD
jgi:hypothetical protein